MPKLTDQDISFMEYFLELTEHGIMTSTQSSDVLDKLTSLGLENEVDYLLQDVLQQVDSGVKHCKCYILTPEAFKKCLMRSNYVLKKLK